MKDKTFVGVLRGCDIQEENNHLILFKRGATDVKRVDGKPILSKIYYCASIDLVMKASR